MKIQAIALFFYTFGEKNYLPESFYSLLYSLFTQVWLSVGEGGGHSPTIMKALQGDAREISSLFTSTHLRLELPSRFTLCANCMAGVFSL